MSNKIELVLSAKRREFRVHNEPGTELADAEFATVRKKIRERDKNICRGCGFHSRQPGLYMQVHHLDDDHANNDPSNLVTLCLHCHASFHIGFWGIKGEARIVYLPEIAQWQVSHLSRLLLVSLVYKEQVEKELVASTSNRSLYRQGAAPPGNPQLNQKAKMARKLFDGVNAVFNKVKNREEAAKELLKTSDPHELANVLTQLPEEAYRKRHMSLRHFRLVLTGDHRDNGKPYMDDIAREWLEKTGPFSGIPPTEWAKLLPQQASGIA